jgi:molybdopterin synthase catalytic subunit
MDKTILVDGPIRTSLISMYLGKLSGDMEAGAHSLFLGQVRNDMINDRRVKAIEYSAYAEMVEKECGMIKDTVMAAFNDVRDIIILHSTGVVKAGEISLMVMITAGHRDHATRACRHVLEMIKENFPVWKKEILDDGSHKWHS